jgi:hypothetical protein
MGQVSRRDLPPSGMRFSPPANHYEEWHDEGGDLLTQIRWGLAQSQKDQKVDAPYNRTAHADANSKLHFVLHSHPHRGDVFGCICLTDRVK